MTTHYSKKYFSYILFIDRILQFLSERWIDINCQIANKEKPLYSAWQLQYIKFSSEILPFRQSPYPLQFLGHVDEAITSKIVSFCELLVEFVLVKFSILFASPKQADAKLLVLTSTHSTSPVIYNVI